MKPKMVKLNPQQKKLWEDTKVALLWHCPAFSHILYTMMDNVNNETVAYFTDDDTVCPIAATDGTTLFLNVNRFFNYNLYERIFICAHEILHCIFNHLVLLHGWKRVGSVQFSDGKKLEYDHGQMNVALDYIINDILIDSKVGQFNKDWLHEPNIVNRTMNGADAYRKIFKRPPKGGGGAGVGMPGSGGGNNPKGKQFDNHLAPGTGQGKDPHQAASDRQAADAEWKTQVAAAAHAAKVQGKLPAGLERVFSEFLEPQVDWREHIQGLFARKVGGGTYNWRKADRRFIIRDIYAPARSGFGAGAVVVGADTSGSIGDKELDMFFAEVGGILEDVRPEKVFIVWCDAKVQRVDECDEPSDLYSIRHKGAPGGGGTSFVPVFEWINNHGIQPDAVVYLTDGYGTFPQEKPSYPVIWGNISGPDVTYPFGDVVNVPKQAK